MEKIAIFPGSFDPFTIGHESIVRRGMSLFDKIIIGIGSNSNKPGYFPLETRLKWIKAVFENDRKIEVQTYQGLTVDFCIKTGAQYILRGIRTSADFEYERAIAQVNKKMRKDIETVILLTTPEMSSITSSIVRDIILHQGDASIFLPQKIYEQL
ncbi:MAG: pantetheine-phosphate adenylyltransferase [Bacteroidia bacterium]|nr:MAG: pantetheine-phosphate adenylyltransferase [Bacteroidia bacterium]